MVGVYLKGAYNRGNTVFGVPSMHFTSASSKSDVSKPDTRYDFWPLLRLPWFDKDGGASVFSTSNKVSAVHSLTCSEM